MNLESLTDMLSWFLSSLLNGFNHIRAMKLHRKQIGVCKSSWNQPEETFTLTILRNFGKAIDDISWKPCASTPHRSETSGTACREVPRERTGFLLYCCRQVWMKIGWRNPWDAIYEIFSPVLLERQSGLPETALEDPVNPFEDPVNSLHYSGFSWGSALTLSALPASVSVSQPPC